MEALAGHLNYVFTDRRFIELEQSLYELKEEGVEDVQVGIDKKVISELETLILEHETILRQSRMGVGIEFNIEFGHISITRQKYHCILAYYKADRVFRAEQPKHVEKVQLKDDYGLEEFPRNEFIKYLLDLKVTEVFARSTKKSEKADEIQVWFRNLEQLLKKIFDDESVKLAFDEDTFEFHILQQGKEPFDFNTLSSGY